MNNLVLVGIVIIGFVAAFSAYLIFSGIIKIPVSATTPRAMTMTSMEIAMQPAAFLDGLKMADQHYYFSKSCEQNASYNGCLIYNLSANASNAWPLYAYTAL